VQVNFLLVGHTHDRVDQFFSCISRQLGREDAWTPAELRQQIRAAYSIGQAVAMPESEVEESEAGESESDSEESEAEESKTDSEESKMEEDVDRRFQGDLTIDPLCRERPSVILLDQIMEWSLWLGLGGSSVRKQPLAGSPMAVVGQRVDSSLLPHILEEVDIDEDNISADVNATQSEVQGGPHVPVAGTETRSRPHGLPVFCGKIKHINKPQVFLFTMNLLEEVVMRVGPSSYTLDVKRTAEGKLQFKLEPVELQAPVVLMTADASVPYIDPIPSPPQPFPYKSLLATYTTMLQQASASFTARRQQEWYMELERVSKLLERQAHCDRCKDLQGRISLVKVATGRKKQRMTEEQLHSNKENARMRCRLQAELTRHLSSGHQPVVGTWTKPWQPWSTRLLDPVQMRIPGRVSEELVQLDSELRQQLHRQQKEGHVEQLHKFILDSTLSAPDRMRFEHALQDQSSTPLISLDSTKAAREAAAAAAEAPQGVDITKGQGQNRDIAIQVGDIVAIPIDNYQWPEYPVSIALVVGVTPPGKAGRKRGRGKAKPKGRKGKEVVTSQSKRRCTRGVKATAHGSSNPSSSLPSDPRTISAADVQGEEEDVDVDMDDDREVNGKTQLEVQYYYLRYPSYSHACRVLDAKVEHYKRFGAAGAITECLDKALTLFEMKPRKKVARRSQDSRSQEDEKGQAVEPSTTESSADSEYRPQSEEEEEEDPLLKQRAWLASRAEGQPALTDTPSFNPDAVPLPSRPPTTTGSSSSSSSSSLSSPCQPLESHLPFSTHYVWPAGGLHMPGTWWKVFTQINDLFEKAKPTDQVLRGLAPWFSVADLELEQLSMVLLPPAQRKKQLVLQEEVLCWDQPNLALTKDGYFTVEFAIKLHHCLNLARDYNGGYYGDDRDSDSEVQAAPRGRPSAHGRQPIVSEEAETKEQLPVTAAPAPQSRTRPRTDVTEPATASVTKIGRSRPMQQSCSSSSSFVSSLGITAASALPREGQPLARVMSSQQSSLRMPRPVSRESNGASLSNAVPIPPPSPSHRPPSTISNAPLIRRQGNAGSHFISQPSSPSPPSSFCTSLSPSYSSGHIYTQTARQPLTLTQFSTAIRRTSGSTTGLWPGTPRRILVSRAPRVSAMATSPIWRFPQCSAEEVSDLQEAEETPSGIVEVRKGGTTVPVQSMEVDRPIVDVNGDEGQQRPLTRRIGESCRKQQPPFVTVVNSGMSESSLPLRGPRTSRHGLTIPLPPPLSHSLHDPEPLPAGGLSAMDTESNPLPASNPHPRYSPDHSSTSASISTHTVRGTTSADLDSMLEVQGRRESQASSVSTLLSNSSFINTPIRGTDGHRHVFGQLTAPVDSSIAAVSPFIAAPPASTIATNHSATTYPVSAMSRERVFPYPPPL
jgi:hypothetical protein